ncbi:MAG: hypothetical protein CME70_21030 [Halobacteriovorax sp.]|nr:hypothetical protein [Halobacteriovorax sp.]|tara:strand:+ start:61559 stop:62932 length:1374 start_codon:yes stop_codon:yes gene_type:complete
MTKKNDPFNGAEIEQDSEPLHFEEASSLFEESEEKKAVKPVEQPIEKEEVIDTQPASPSEPEEEIMTHDDAQDIHTIGAFLKQMREEKGINIKIISQHTKISVTNLELLEADDLENLPNRAYVKGYVKSYAKTLQLNQADCLELLDATYGIEKEPEEPKPIQSSRTVSSESASNEEDSEANGIKIGIAVGAVAIIVFLLVLNNTGKEENTSDDVEVVKEEKVEPVKKVVPQTLGATTPLKETAKLEEELSVKVTSTESDKPEAIATPVPKEQLEEIKKVEPTPAPVVEAKPEPTPVPVVEEKKKEEVEKKEEKISFRSLASSLYSDDTNMPKEEIDRLLPTKYRAAVVEGSHNVFINAYKEDSWLTYKADDGPIKKFVLRKGRTILIRGKLIRVFLGNLGAVKVFRNNIPQKITSSSGVKSLVFPQERASEFVIPLFIFNKNGGVQTSEEYLAENPE